MLGVADGDVYAEETVREFVGIPHSAYRRVPFKNIP